jgi:hypothetical protein
MKLFVVFISLVLIGLSGLAQDNILEAKSVLDRKGEVCVIVDIQDRSEIINLSKNFIIDKVKNEEVYVYLNKNNLSTFATSYPEFQVFYPKENSNKANSMAHSISDLTNAWDKYPTYDLYVELMNKFATDYPDICKLESILYFINAWR